MVNLKNYKCLKYKKKLSKKPKQCSFENCLECFYLEKWKEKNINDNKKLDKFSLDHISGFKIKWLL